MQLVSAWSFSLRAGTAAKWANVPQIGGSEAETCARGFEEQAVGAVNPVRFFFYFMLLTVASPLSCS